MENKRNKWLALGSVTLAFTFAFLIRYIWSPLMLDASKEFGINSFQMGFYATIFMIGYLITMIPGGILADRLSAKSILLTAISISTICSVLFSLSKSYWIGFALRFLEGLCCGGIYSSCAKVVYQYFEPKDRAVPMGILLSSPPLGILLANTLGEPLNDIFGWRKTVLLVSLLGIVVVLYLFFSVDKFDVVKDIKKRPPLLEGVKLYVADIQQLLLGCSGLLLMFSSVAFATWMNTYMKADLGFSGVKGGMLLTIYSISSIIATCFSGAIVKKFKINPKHFLIFSYVGALLCTIFFSVCKSYTALMTIGIFYGMFVNFPSAHLVSFAIQRSDEKHIATTTSFENFVFQIGAAFQSAIIGAAATKAGNYHIMWTIFIVCGVLSVVLICVFNPEKKRKIK